METQMKYPGVGTGVWIRKGGKILLGQRKGRTGKDTWCVPGGRVEMFEKALDCANRELKEEAGVEASPLKFAGVTDDMSPDIGTHYLTVHYIADWVSGDPRDEEGKIENWKWYDLDEFPKELFGPTMNFIKNGYNPLTI